jgi:hypothetical protein
MLQFEGSCLGPFGRRAGEVGPANRLQRRGSGLARRRKPRCVGDVSTRRQSVGSAQGGIAVSLRPSKVLVGLGPIIVQALQLGHLLAYLVAVRKGHCVGPIRIEAELRHSRTRPSKRRFGLAFTHGQTVFDRRKKSQLIPGDADSLVVTGGDSLVERGGQRSLPSLKTTEFRQRPGQLRLEPLPLTAERDHGIHRLDRWQPCRQVGRRRQSEPPTQTAQPPVRFR